MQPSRKKLLALFFSSLAGATLWWPPCPTNAAEGSFGAAVSSRPNSPHWAFQLVKRPEVPWIARAPIEPINAIDYFVLARLEKRGLSMSPPASKAQLIRRVTFDLIGLPPTPREMDEFVNDRSDNAYEKLIDRLLASKHYGERWGRHWLDLARFAESDGFEHDAARPYSWRYRDYVIAAFNSDKPYDRFIKEQIAGDELWPDSPDALTATGFNLLGPDMVDSSDQVQRRHNTLNDMTDTTSLVFLGLTIGCARCHDHKLEPISQRDYYQLQAFFGPAKFERDQPIPTAEVRAAYEEALKKAENDPKTLQLAALEKPVRQKLFEAKVAKLSSEAQMAYQTPAAERNAEQANLVLETRDKVVITEKEVANAFSGTEKEAWKKLSTEVKSLPKPSPLPKAMTLACGEPTKTFVLHRGDYNHPEEEVEPGFPTILANSTALKTPVSRERTALAEWIASRNNPLTARVMVNRIWQHHFGRGIVGSPSDFGTRGDKPSHPQLLDWLASEFMDHGWSIKHLHKLMLMSATYRQQSGGEIAADPENRLLSHMDRSRLEGEVIRDSLLAVSGQLNPQMGGHGVFPPIPKELFQGATGWTPSKSSEENCRRSIYIFARRNLRFPFLEVFDAPDNNLSCPVRERSTTAPQALTLLNADDVVTAARLTAERLAKSGRSRDEQLVQAYRLILGRLPTAKETDLGRNFLAQYPLDEFCRALFNLNDFVYVN
ncbi:MAG TPA: DUF1549 and DUF1553 domain-containing protein [Verrucomicrobiae bacterium]|jgi:hypothetical protein|nr:DUF1549 and DUF1553 domain-containing protein [Verrucomicrobiae bacterium]